MKCLATGSINNIRIFINAHINFVITHIIFLNKYYTFLKSTANSLLGIFMNKQIDKLEMLFTLQKSVFCAQLAHQKKQALLIAIVVAFFILVVIAINAALFFHLNDNIEFAKNAWLMAALNTVLAFIPLGITFTQRQVSAPESAANEIREALLSELKDNVETSYSEVKQGIDKVQGLSKDIKTFSEGGLTALIPMIKLASTIVSDKAAVEKRDSSEEK